MKDKLEKIDDFHWRLDKSVRPEMREDAMIIASEEIIKLAESQAIEQLTNVAIHTVVCDVRERTQVEDMVANLPESHAQIDR